MAKSATFGVMHVGIAFGVTYVLTGNAWVAGAVTIVEPAINTVAHYFFDKWWDEPPAALQAVARRWRWRGRRGPAPHAEPSAA